MVYVLAALMGLVLGFAQWFVLGRHVARAALWMPSNALAWALGMVVVFVGVDAVVALKAGPGAFLATLATLLLTGTMVDAIHGLAVLWLLRPRCSGQNSDIGPEQVIPWRS